MSIYPHQDNLAFTIWFNDLVILDVWLSYYSKWFDKLYVICNKTKEEYIPELEKRKEIYPMEYELFDGAFEDVGVSNRRIMDLQHKFIKNYHWVLFCNCDEIIAVNPKTHNDLKFFMKHHWAPYAACEGFEVIEVDGELPIDFSKPILKQRRYWIKNKSMNKIILSTVPLEWNNGQHQILSVSAESSELIRNTGLYLIHLRHFNLKDEKENPRDFGPFFHHPVKTVLDAGADPRLRMKIPGWVKRLI